MPIYDFACRLCGHHFESISYPNEPVQCPNCKRREVDRQPAVIATYKIRGDNSASVTPKRHRGEKG